MKFRSLLTVLLVAASLAFGCTASDSDFDPTRPGSSADSIAAAKADGAFSSQEIEIGDSAVGEVAGDAIALFQVDLSADDRIRVEVQRTGGDYSPAAYLYFGTEDFVAPNDFNTTSTRVDLEYAIRRGGEYYIVVKTRSGDGHGTFELSTECAGGACAGSSVPSDPLQAQSHCIQEAARCALLELPRYNGAVGESRAHRLFSNCLSDLDPVCADACSGEGADACSTIVGTLPRFADEGTSCHQALDRCLVGCDEISGHYGGSSLDDTSAVACWTGYNGNCLEYAYAHTACGGSGFSAGTYQECHAYCQATEGAFDEGPFDGCMEGCEELRSEIDNFILDVANEAGEYVGIDSSDAFAYVSLSDVPNQVRNPADDFIESYIAQATEHESEDFAGYSEENIFSIEMDGEVVGYMLGIDYFIDDTLFDGGGINLFINLDGQVVTETEWWS